MQLTPEDLQKIRTKNIANLLRIAQSGKPLTRAQQAELEAFSAGGRLQGSNSSAFVRTQGELAEALGVSRKTIGNCLQRYAKHPAHPVPKTCDDGRYDVASWVAFIQHHNIARKAEDVEDDEDDAEPGSELRSVTDWKKEKVRLECERIKQEIEKQSGLVVPVAELQALLGTMLSAFCTALDNLPGRAAQQLIGLRDFHEIEEILRTEVDVTKKTLHACPYLDGAAAPEPATPPPSPPQSWDDVAGERTPTTRKKAKAPVKQATTATKAARTRALKKGRKAK